MPYAGGCGPDCAHKEQRYGLLPIFRKAVWWKKDFGKPKGCSNCGPTVGGMYGYGGYGGVPGAGMPGTPGGQMPGTLVFPNHWYARSPRDFFMHGTGR
jgi:hypothetical protein